MSIVYVDLSAKVEQWNKDSAIALCNDVQRVCLVTSKVKRQLRQQLMQRHGKKSLTFRMLAVLIYFLLRGEMHHVHQVVIDRDYSGSQAEATIKALLLDLLYRDRPDLNSGFIRFENVAGNNADLFARETFQGKRKPDQVVTLKELLRLL
jgi:hypothetical protein